MYEMRRIKSEPIFLPTQGIFNLQLGMVWKELAFDTTISYTQQNVIAVTGIHILIPML